MSTLQERARHEAEKYLRCHCDEAYTSRGRSAPDCPRCNYAEDIVDAIVRVATDSVEAEREECARVADIAAADMYESSSFRHAGRMIAKCIRSRVTP